MDNKMGDGIHMQSPLNFLIKLITLQYIVLPDWLSASPVAVTGLADWGSKSAVKEGTHCLPLNTLLPLCRSCYVINLYCTYWKLGAHLKQIDV